jgi:hypothetical protein
VEIGDHDGLLSAGLLQRDAEEPRQDRAVQLQRRRAGLRQIGDSSYYASAKSGSAKYGERGFSRASARSGQALASGPTWT